MKKILSIIALVSIIIGTCNISFAKENLRETIISINISEDFKEWDKLSKEEKNKTIMPTATTINMNDKDTKNANSFMFGMQNFFTKVSIPSKYILTQDINVPVKHQGSTSECWAFSMTSVLESYLAKSGEKAVIPRYSARHMDYATSETFLDGKNPIGYSRELKSGGNSAMALGYLTNGTGAVLEENMPFEDNEEKIKLEEIQNKKPVTRVTDAKEFPTSNRRKRISNYK